MEGKPRFAGFFNFLETVMHMAGLNLLFLAFSIPLITGGAAMTALFSGLRAMIKKEPCFRAFFKAFKAGFLRATLAWIIILIPTVPMVDVAWQSIENYAMGAGSLPLMLLCLLVSVLLLSILYMLFLFYSRFECKLGQLFYFSAHMALSWPIRSLLVTVMMLVPIVLAKTSAWFLILTPLWLFFYFSLVGVAAIWLMNLPFARFARQTMGMPANGEAPKTEKLDMQNVKEVEE